MAQILVVSNDTVGLAHTVAVLNDAGYQARGASSFEDANRQLAHGSPDMVIADERLGAFNGLHVILRARAEHPDVSAIITSPTESLGLAADARSLNVKCMLKPQNRAAWVTAMLRALQSDYAAGSLTVDALHASQHN
jgi:DNA-binding NtrC family response regulator